MIKVSQMYRKNALYPRRVHTTSHTGHFTACWPSCTPRLLLPPIRMALWLSMSNIALLSKLCGHLVLVTGSFIGTSVIGHLILMRSDKTSMSSSSSASAAWPPALRVVVFTVRGDSANHVDEFGNGGASSPGCSASCIVLLKPI